MQKKLMAIPAALITAYLVAAPAFAQVTHVNPGFSKEQGVMGGAGEGCVRSGQVLNNGYTCDKPAAPAAMPTPAPTARPAAPVPAQPAMAPRTEIANIRADKLFDTGKDVVKNPSELATVASQIKALKSYGAIEVVGHADYRGSTAANQKLSERRSLAVSRVLTQNGVPAAKVRANGVGEGQPVVGEAGCKGKRGAALSECLAPDRRVTVNVIDGVK